MKRTVFVAILCILCALIIPYVNADQEQSQKGKFAIELLYRHFESHYTPRDLLQRAQREAIYLAEQFEKGEEAWKKVLDEYNRPFSQWNQLDGLHPFSHIFDLKNASCVTHPNPGLSKLLNVKNLMLRFKDHAGRLVTLELKNKTEKNPTGSWTFHYTTFVKSETRIATLLYALYATVTVPGTQYCVTAIMPHRGYSIEEMDKKVDYLDSMVEHWSIME